MFIKPTPVDQPLNEQGGNHAGPPEVAAGEAAWRGGVALETNAGFAGMARGIAIDAKPGERGPAVAKVGSSESNREGAGAFWSESGPLKSKSVSICTTTPRNAPGAGAVSPGGCNDHDCGHLGDPGSGPDTLCSLDAIPFLRKLQELGLLG
jgi:hypothetical protein